MKDDLRCSCKKLVCQIEGDTIIIKCRHCKKMLYIHTRGLINLEYKLEEPSVNLNSIISKQQQPPQTSYQNQSH